MKKYDEFKGKVCIVTGAASGLGFGISKHLLSCGAFVCLADIDQKGLEEAELQLNKYSPKLITFPFDVTDKVQIQKLVSKVHHLAGSIDFMFNNAGVGGSLPIQEATSEHWEKIINLNLWSVINCTNTVLPIMVAQGTGHIVNTSSISGLIPVPGQALYNTTKYAVVGFSESLRIELAPKGINVSVICPGPFESKIWGKPIIGESADVPAPAHAASVEEIVTDTLDAVLNNIGIIVTPKTEKRNWRIYRWLPALVDKSLKKLAQV